MPIISQLADLTATYDGAAGVDVDGPGTASISVDVAGNVVSATTTADDPAYDRMLSYALRVLSRNRLSG